MSEITYLSGCSPVPTFPKESVEWHLERAQTIGASEVGVVLGCSKFGGLLGLVLDKRDALRGTPRIWDNEAMSTGRLAEDLVLRLASEKLAVEIVPGVPVRLGDTSATPDGLIANVNGVVISVVEAKLDRGHNDWKDVIENGFAHLTGKDSRLAYWWQVQTQIYVTGAKVGYLAIWTVYDFFLIQIVPDEGAAGVIVEATASALGWVNAGDQSLPTASDADSLSTLARTINPASEGPVEVEGEVAEAIETYASLNVEIKALEERQDAAKRIILEAHRNAAKLSTVSGYKSSFSDASERASFDSKAFTESHPELAATFQKVVKVSASCRVTAPKAKKG